MNRPSPSVATWLALLVALAGCSGSTARGRPPPPPDASGTVHGARSLPLVLWADGAPSRQAQSAADVAELAASGQPFGMPVERIVALGWQEHVFDDEALQRALDATRDAVRRRAFRAREGLEASEVLRVLCAAYAAALEQRYGVTDARAHVSEREGRAVLVMEAWLANDEPGRARQLRWEAGVATGRGEQQHASVPMDPGPPVPNPFVTVVMAHHGRYYAFPDLSWSQARFRPPTDGSRAGSFRGEVRRVHVEEATFTTAGGRRGTVRVPIERWEPYYTLRPEGPNPFGLSQGSHLVEVTFDATALPSSAPMVEALTVLPLDFGGAYPQLLARFRRDQQAAAARLDTEIGRLRASSEAESRAWARRLSGSASGVRAEWRAFGDVQPSFSWSAEAHTLAVTLRESQTHRHATTARVPNPKRENVACPDGAPCALPPEFLEARHEAGYRVDFSATYVLDESGQVVSAEVEPMRATGEAASSAR